METVLIENALTSGPKDCSTPKPLNDRHDRGTLKVLKESTNGNSSLPSVRKDENKSKVKIVYDNKSSCSSSSGTVKIYQDSKVVDDGHSVRCSRSVQTEEFLLESYIQAKQKNLNVSTDSGNLSECFDQEAYDLMVNESIPEHYWKDVAEQRRKALNDTLEENERLSFEVEHLKEENRRLSDIASKAEILENLLHEALSDDTEPEKEPSPGEANLEPSAGEANVEPSAGEANLETSAGKSNVEPQSSSSTNADSETVSSESCACGDVIKT